MTLSVMGRNLVLKNSLIYTPRNLLKVSNFTIYSNKGNTPKTKKDRTPANIQLFENEHKCYYFPNSSKLCMKNLDGSFVKP